MTQKRYFIETWGCQMNEHDTEKMAGLLQRMGFSPTQQVEDADVYLLNTCTIREKAAEKVFSRLGVLRSVKQRKSGDMIIGVTGCVAQQEGQAIFKRAPYVDLVMGTQALKNLPEMIDQIKNREGRQVDVSKDPDNHLFPVKVPVRSSSVRARITIMEGCNNYCTYCIVPFTRGRERSRPIEDIVQEGRYLAAQGFKEIELLGQNVNSYFSTANFAELLRQMNTLEGIEVVRFVSPHPKDFDQEVIDVIRDCPKIATNIHLPAQSGNSRVLKRMGREYTRELYLEKVDMIRNTLGDAVSLTSDFIVGFPGEDEAAFEETMTLLEKVKYDRIFSFMYSPRPGTGALKHGDPVPEEEKQRRLQILQKRQAEIQQELMDGRVGRKVKVLVDAVKPGDKHPLSGRTRDNMMVHIEAALGHPERCYGRIIESEITGAGMHTLRGRLVGQPQESEATLAPLAG